MRHVLFVSLLAFAATAACSGSPAPVPQPTPPVAPTPTPPVAPTPAPTAPTATAAPAVPASKPVAAELLAQSLRFTQSLPAMQLKGTATLVMPELPEEIAAQLEGIELPSFEVELAVAMPNRFALNAGEEGMSRVVCDGAQLLQANDRFQLHSLAPAPKDLLTFFDAPRDALGTPGQGNLRALLAPAGAKKALIDAKQVELVGDGKVGGKDAWQLAIKDEGLACELWVMKGDEPWVLRHKPARQKLDMEALMGGGGEEDEGGSAMSIQPGVEIEFSSCSKGIAKDTFTIEEPKGSTKVDDLQEALMERMQAEMGEMEEGDGEDAEGAEGGGDSHGAHASVGKPAPDVELAMMDGSKQKLADLKGKVVVLDFWATWCGPCVQGLPKVTEVTKKLTDQGVVFVACNLGEDKATIEKFLQKKQLSIAVALCDQAMGGKFGVSGIPHTVVIGADGVVKKVHVGFAPGGEKQLEKDLLEVLGKPATEGQPAEGHKDEKKADAGGK